MDVISVNAKLPFDESQVNWKPITNADRIRAMTDEELALYLHNCEAQAAYMGSADSKALWLDWLKQGGE